MAEAQVTFFYEEPTFYLEDGRVGVFEKVEDTPMLAFKSVQRGRFVIPPLPLRVGGDASIEDTIRETMIETGLWRAGEPVHG